MDFAEKFHELGKGSDIDKIASQFKEVDSSVIDMAKLFKTVLWKWTISKAKTLEPLLLLPDLVVWQNLPVLR